MVGAKKVTAGQGCAVLTLVLLCAVVAFFWLVDPKPDVIEAAAVPAPEPLRTPAQSRTVGLGVAREALNKPFSLIPFSLEFVRVPLDGGAVRTIGKSVQRGMFLEIDGPDDDVTEASLMVAVSPESHELAASADLTFLQVVAPGWAGREEWLKTAVDANGGKTVANGIEFDLTVAKRAGILTLSASPPAADQ